MADIEMKGSPKSASPSPASFPPVDNEGAVPVQKNLDFILDIPMQVTVQVGSTKMAIRELLQLGQGSVVELWYPGRHAAIVEIALSGYKAGVKVATSAVRVGVVNQGC